MGMNHRNIMLCEKASHKDHILCNFTYMKFLEKVNLQRQLISGCLGLVVGVRTDCKQTQESGFW